MNRRKHAENGNPRTKTSNDWKAEFMVLETWVRGANRMPRQRSNDSEERKLAQWINNVRKRNPLMDGQVKF